MTTWEAGEPGRSTTTALDFVHSVREEVVGEINYENCEVEDLSMVLAAVAVLTALCEHCWASPPDPATVARWRGAHLRIFDADYDNLKPAPGHKEAVRADIEQVFARLRAVAAKRAGA